jgi:hypothetical protein
VRAAGIEAVFACMTGPVVEQDLAQGAAERLAAAAEEAGWQVARGNWRS